MRPAVRRAATLAGVVAINLLLVLLIWQPDGWDIRRVEVIASTPTLEARRTRIARGNVIFAVTSVRFDASRVVARLVDVGAGHALHDVAGDATLTINAGYFDAAFAPLGLYRMDGRETSPLLARSPLSGVVTIDRSGRLDVVPRDDASVASATSAFQSGPFLIDPGGRLGIRSDDGKVAERTAIALDGESIVVIVTTPTTLRALAECLHDRPDAVGMAKIDRALNLDGGPSTGFVLNVDARRLEALPRGPVRSVLKFSAKP